MGYLCPKGADANCGMWDQVTALRWVKQEILCDAMLCYTAPHYTILYYILYYTILYYTILYYTILYYTILYYTIPYCQAGIMLYYCIIQLHHVCYYIILDCNII